jgi:protein-L-isoaspartate(D-aspartate) O-methyltransferase
MSDDPFTGLREKMVSEQIARRGLQSPRLLEAFRSVPRHSFVPPDCQKNAYDDGPLPIGIGQTISQPYIVALMTSLLALEGDENVLEIGTGSGYQAAVLSRLAKTVHTIERHVPLAEHASEILSTLGYANIFVHTGDGTRGWPDDAPYQGILVTAAAPSPPQPLLDQLSEGGRLVIPVGDHYGQDLQVWERRDGKFEPESIIPVVFVPLRGEFGWKDEEWNESRGFFFF